MRKDILRSLERTFRISTALFIVSLFIPGAKDASPSVSHAALQLLNSHDSIVLAQGTIPEPPPTPSGFPVPCVIDTLGADSSGQLGAVEIGISDPHDNYMEGGGWQSLDLKDGQTLIKIGKIDNFSLVLVNTVSLHTALVNLYKNGCNVDTVVIDAKSPLGAEIKLTATITEPQGIAPPPVWPASTVFKVIDNGSEGVTIRKETSDGASIVINLIAGQVAFGDEYIVSAETSAVQNLSSLTISPSQPGPVEVTIDGTVISLGLQTAGSTTRLKYDEASQNVTLVLDTDGNGVTDVSYEGSDKNNDGQIAGDEIVEAKEEEENGPTHQIFLPTVMG